MLGSTKDALEVNIYVCGCVFAQHSLVAQGHIEGWIPSGLGILSADMIKGERDRVSVS